MAELEYLDEMPVLDAQAAVGDIVVDDDGNIMPTEGMAEAQSDESFYDNLAEYMDEDDLAALADEIVEEVDHDKSSMEPWLRHLEEGIKELGWIEDKNRPAPFKGAASVTHPLLSEAVVQFQARALAEVFPSKGPVKSFVVGEQTEDKRRQAQRVENYMNYQMLEEDTSFFDELDKLLMFLPLVGSVFKKVYYDERKQTVISSFVPPEKFIAPYVAKSLEDAPRYTEILEMSDNEVRKDQVSGFFRDIELTETSPDMAEEGVDDTYDDVERRDPDIAEGDAPRTIYVTCCEKDLKGYEDEDGIALPYIVYTDVDTKKILAIYRNWDEADEYKTKKLNYIQYNYAPGPGFYGIGLYHMIGGLAKASTGSVRVLLDSAAFATLQGGIKSSDVRGKSGEIILQPGKYVDVNMTSEDLAKAFYTPPFKEPSPTMFRLLEYLVESGRRFASITEAMVGDAPNTGPVGTTVALIEQASKVFSAVHKRLHRSAHKEYRLRAALNYEYMPERYPYDVQGESREIFKEDFDERVDVIPVSDPNIYSSTQRIAMAQAEVELANTAPDIIRRERAYRDMLVALNISDVDGLIIDPNNVKRFDAVSEGARLIDGKPIKAFYDQNHDAHLAIHQAQIELAKSIGDDQQSQIIITQIIEHMNKHRAYKAHIEMSNIVMQQSGQQMPPIDLYDDTAHSEMPPQIENQVSEIAAQNVSAMIEYFQSRIPPPPEDAETQAKIERENQLAMAESQRRDVLAEKDSERKDFLAERGEARKDRQAKQELSRKSAMAAIDINRQDEMAEIQVEQVKKSAKANKGTSNDK